MQKFQPIQYLQMDIAANHSQDKADWAARQYWFDQNQTRLRELIPTAKEPALYFAGILAWEDHLAGKPSGYPISLDATASGLQILACLTGDRSAASLCNVIPTGSRKDAYTVVYNAMLQQLNEISQITRDDTKRAIMTSLYSSTAVPKEVFGEGILLDTFYKTMEGLAPAAWELNEAFLSLWDPNAMEHSWVLPDNFHVVTKSMNQVKETVHFLNAPYDTFYKINMPMEGGRSLGANVTHSIDGFIVREMTRRCSYDAQKIDAVREAIKANRTGNTHIQNLKTPDAKMVALLWKHYQESGFLSARILDHLRMDNMACINMADRGIILDLINSLPEKPFDVATVHDCFRCLPNYGNDIRLQYNNQLKLLAQSNMLGFLLTQIVGRPINIGKLDPNLYQHIIGADYALS